MTMTPPDAKDFLPNDSIWQRAIALVASSLQFTGLERDAPSDDDSQDTVETTAIVKHLALDPTCNRHHGIITPAIESTNSKAVAHPWMRFERSHFFSSSLSTMPADRETDPNVMIPRPTTIVDFQRQIIKRREVQHRAHNRHETASSSTMPNVVAPRGMTVVEYQQRQAAQNQPPKWISFEVGSNVFSTPSEDWSLSECAGCEERDLFLEEEPSVIDAKRKLNDSGTKDTLQTTILYERGKPPAPKFFSLFRRNRLRVHI